MAERGFQTELWTDPFIQGLSPEAKLLFIYLWTNKHCNQAGLYEISLKTMAFDTGLSIETLPGLIKSTGTEGCLVCGAKSGLGKKFSEAAVQVAKLFNRRGQMFVIYKK